MSRKSKRHKNNLENQSRNEDMAMSTSSDIGTTAKQTLDTMVSTVNSNKLLVGGIAGACGAAIFLLATDSGKRLRSGIQDRAVDLYDFVSDQATNGWCQVRDLAQNMLFRGESEVEEASAKMRRVA